MFKKDAQIHATVRGKDTVWFHGEELHLAPATRKALAKDDDYQVDGKLYWRYKGRLLAEIYEEKYPRP